MHQSSEKWLFIFSSSGGSKYYIDTIQTSRTLYHLIMTGKCISHKAYTIIMVILKINMLLMSIGHESLLDARLGLMRVVAGASTLLCHFSPQCLSRIA